MPIPLTKKFAAKVAAEHKRRIGRKYPPKSQKGEYPAKRTGGLQRAVEVVKLPAGGYTIGYSKAVEGQAAGLAGMGRKGPGHTISDMVRAAGGADKVSVKKGRK